MAKLSLPSFVGQPGATQLNTWKSLIEAQAEDTLSLTGVLPNSMTADLDMNSNLILNSGFDPDNPNSIITLGEADNRYVSRMGDSMLGALTVLAPVGSSEPAQKGQLDAEIAAREAGDNHVINLFQAGDAAIYSYIYGVEAEYQAADANIQAQLTGNVPLEASAFSPISWHEQIINNSVDIPENKNAGSWGPTMTVNPGVAVTIGVGSYWTIVNGELV